MLQATKRARSSDVKRAGSRKTSLSAVEQRRPIPCDRNLHSEIEANFIQQLTDFHATPTTSAKEQEREIYFFTLQPTDSNLDSASQGTVAKIPLGLTRSMEEEFKGSKFEKDYNYVVYGKACDASGESEWAQSSTAKSKYRQDMVRDAGHHNWTLDRFGEELGFWNKGFTRAEIAMLRIFPTAYEDLNKEMRHEVGLTEWATSISILTSAIIKLSALSVVQPLYRSIPFSTCSIPDGPLPSGNVFFDDGVTSFTPNINVALKYADAPDVPSIVLCLDPSWACRAAALTKLSQYPLEDEYLMPPCTSLEITRVTSVGPKKLLHCIPHVCTMRHYTDNLPNPWSSPNDPLTKEELNNLIKIWGDCKLPTSPEEFGKFNADAKDYIVGEPIVAALGLEDYMKKGFGDYWTQPDSVDQAVAAIETEFRMHGTAEDREWFDYIMNHPASERKYRQGTRDKGHGPITLAGEKGFASKKEAVVANLNLAHVLALRLYTSPVYRSLNDPLRSYRCDPDGTVTIPRAMKAPHRFPVTVSYIQKALLKLRADECDRGKQGELLVMWRGNQNLIVSHDYLAHGGVETGIISTSLKLETSVQYSYSSCPVIFKIITRSFMERGAFLDWVSVFPEEQECCFPPLTFFSPTGRHQVVKLSEGRSVTVIEVTPRL